MPEEMISCIIAISNRSLCTRPLLEQLHRVCLFHPAALVLREKDMTERAYEAMAREVMKLCASHQVPCILHTFTGAARSLGARAIHLPLWKLEDAAGNRELDGFTSVGVSVHSPEEAKKAQSLGATYVTAGHIYATECKKGLPPRGTAFLKEVCETVHIPVYAIGGIRLDEARINELLSLGAAGGCIMSGMMRL